MRNIRFLLINRLCLLFFFFFNDTATTEIYTLSLHDALPIKRHDQRAAACGPERRRCPRRPQDRKSTRLNSSHVASSYAAFCLKKKKQHQKEGEDIKKEISIIKIQKSIKIR